MSFNCYCLSNQEGKTYVGFTTDVEKRLRQHNGEIKGGAKATKGYQWVRILVVTGFPTQKSALQFEWKWKYLTRKAKGSSAVERRCNALLELLHNAVLFSSFENPLLILLEDSHLGSYFQDKDIPYGIVVG